MACIKCISANSSLYAQCTDDNTSSSDESQGVVVSTPLMNEANHLLKVLKVVCDIIFAYVTSGIHGVLSFCQAPPQLIDSSSEEEVEVTGYDVSSNQSRK